MMETLQAALAQVPGALLVIVFLGGPTAAWIIFRVLNASSRPRPTTTATGLLWVCASCRSANDTSRDRCYRCGVAADVDALEVVAPDVDPRSGLRPVMTPGLDLGGRAPVAVGPGKAAHQDPGIGSDAIEAGPELEAGTEPEAEPVLVGAAGSKSPRPRRTSATADGAKATARARTSKPAPTSKPARTSKSAPTSKPARTPRSAPTPVMAMDDAPVNVRIEVPKPASARRPKVAAGQARSPGEAGHAEPDSPRSGPSSTS
jgi:hypothetical protein